MREMMSRKRNDVTFSRLLATATTERFDYSRLNREANTRAEYTRSLCYASDHESATTDPEPKSSAKTDVSSRLRLGSDLIMHFSTRI